MLCVFVVHSFVFTDRPNYFNNLLLSEDYEFGDVTKKVVSGFAEEAEITKDQPATIGMKSAKDMEPGIVEALDKWDTLSDKELRDGLDKLEKYAELVENDQRGEEKR